MKRVTAKIVPTLLICVLLLFACVWYWKAADQGSSAAQAQLARMFDQGDGVPFDHAQAEMWYEKAEGTDNDFVQRIPTKHAAFICDDGQRFTITFNQRTDTARLSFANSRTVRTLKNSRPGSGVAYENKTFSYQERGGTVTFASPKGETICHAQ